MTALPSDSILMKLFHQKTTDRELAEIYGVTVQAVNMRIVGLGLRRRPFSQEANRLITQRWSIKPAKETSHHKAHAIKALRIYLRKRLGDTDLSAKQVRLADAWETGLRSRNEVLCYDRDTEAGWFYRPRRPEDGRLVIDWPEDMPRPERVDLEALELPETPAEANN